LRLKWHGDVKNPYKVIFRRPHGEQPVGRQRREWTRNIQMDFFCKRVVRMGGGWNWLRIVPNGGLWY
jgi:hypothetical protein